MFYSCFIKGLILFPKWKTTDLSYKKHDTDDLKDLGLSLDTIFVIIPTNYLHRREAYI